MLPFSVEQVIQMALDAADKALKSGNLIPMKADYNFLEDEEAQTVNSIYNIYREFVMTQDEGQILNELYRKYHAYF